MIETLKVSIILLGVENLFCCFLVSCFLVREIGLEGSYSLSWRPSKFFEHPL